MENKRILNKVVGSFLLMALACLMPLTMVAQTHWQPQSASFEDNMTLTGVIQINGVEQQSLAYEVGAFCGTECRGAVRTVLFPGTQRYVVMLTIFGNLGDQITFKLYNHDQGQELDLVSPDAVTFNSSGYGTLMNPYVLNFTSPVFTISVSANPTAGGSVSGAGTYQSGSNCTLTATPATGYSFVRWTKNGSQVSTSASYSFTVTESASYVAVFSLNSYTITASANPSAGGTVSGGGSYNYGSNCTLTATPATGYSFVRWTKNGSQVSTNASYSFTVTGNASYVAVFSQNSYTISASANPTAGGTVSGGGSYNYGSSCTLTATPATGYTFVKWTKNGSQVSTNASYSFTVTENATYVAVFSLNSYTISASANPTAGGTVSGGGSYNYGSSCTLTATPSTGYTFVKWTKNGNQVSTNASYSFTVTGNASYVAVFSQNSYTISVSANPTAGGTVSGGGSYNYGSTCTLTATPATGYSFVRWTKNGSQVSTSASYSFTVTEDASYVAVFSLNSYTISASANPTAGGTVSGGGSYNYGSTCTLTATPATGYSFVRWTKNGSQVSTNASYSFTVTENATYVAIFNLNSYTISASANPTAGGTVSGGGSYNYGSSCTLTATPATGYSFVRWTKNGSQVSTNVSYSFTVTENATYVAVFSINSYTISASANPTAGGTVSGGGSYNYGSTCTLTATANTGYTFNNWTENGTVVSVTANYSFEVTESRTLVANFTDASGTGKLSGVFSVGEHTHINFSQGNLQYQASSDTWRFAENQWDYVGDGNNNISETYSGWIDLFGWGTSGYNGKYPYITSTEPTDYGDGNTDIAGTNYDWGVYNAISNGGNTAGQWRTLTYDEWRYISDTRSASTVNGTANARYAKAKVANVQGVILFPDSYTHPSDVVQPVGINDDGDTGWNGNNYSADDFASMQAEGAVFLPAAGSRNGTSVNNVGSYVSYWSASLSRWDSSIALYMGFYDASHGYGSYRCHGRSVRLVAHANFSIGINATSSPTEGGTVSGGGSYNYGSTCTLTATANTGYTFNNWTENGTVVSVTANYSFEVTESRNLVANFTDASGTGKLSGVFSVGEYSHVQFSQGNLQYQASSNTWRFAENQWDCVGGENSNISETYSGWIDLFGWGTSGYNHEAVCYQPWSTSTTASDYYAYGSNTYNLYDQTGKADWGYNAISNGGNTASQWRTMTRDEWSYVFNTRSASTVNGVANARYAKAKVANMQGVILFPDSYTHPSGVAQPVGINDGGNTGWNGNNYSADDFASMQTEGAVFLPAAGYRSGTSVYHVGSYGRYWSASYSNSNGAYSVRFYDTYLGTNYLSRYYGQSVRLVVPTNYSFGINATPNPAEGGSIEGAGTFQEGATCTLTATANEGYSFVNWTENGTVVSTEASYSFTVTEDRNLVAVFSLNSYTISASASPSEGGTVSGDGSYNYGSSCTLTATPATGYTFVKWTKNGSQVSTNASYSFTVTENATYVAVFSLNSYTISVSANPTAGGTVSGGGSYNYGSSCTLTATPATGYTFVKWTKNGSQVSTNASYSFTVTENATYVAVFSLNSYIISVSVSPSAGGTVSGSGSYNYGSTCTLTATPATGYTFVKWTKNGSQVSTNASYSFTVTENATYEAVFSLNSYTISLSASPSAGGTVSGSGSYNYGSSCTLTATPAIGYTFVKWTKNGSQVSTNATYSFTVTENATYVAVFSLNSYTISASANPSAGGTVSGGGSYNYGSTCTLTATPATGYSFVRWTKNGSQVSTNASYTFTVTENATYIAVFSNSYTISVSASPSAGGTVSGGGSYNYGSSCTLTATPATGYTFVKWTKNGSQVSTNASYNFTVTENASYVAVFSLNSYTISASANPTAGGTVSGEGSYNYGSSCTLTATPATGYTFVNWTENGTVVPTSVSYTFIVTGNRNLVANFTPIAFHFITAGTWSNASNWSDGVLPGSNNNEVFIDAPCQLDMNTTVASLTVSDGQSLTLQSGKTLTVTNTLINTATTGLIIEDGAQLVHSSENVSAMVKKNITGYGTNMGKYALISNPLATTVNPELANIYHLTLGNYDLYDWLHSTPDNLEWRNYKDNDFMMLPEGYGYLYANQNGMELNFPGILKSSRYRLAKTVSYESNDSEHPGWNLIGNPFMCNAYLVNGNNEILPFYRMNSAGNGFEAVTSGAIAPMEGVFYKASGNGTVYFIRTDFSSYTISVSANPTNGGTISGGGTFNYGQRCTVYATANEGYIFENWTENGTQVSTHPRYTFIVTANRNLVANFTYVPPTYTVSVSANPTNGGSVIGGGSFTEGLSCTVTATPSTNYIFNNWTENGTEVSSNANYTFTVNANRNLVANFTYVPPTYTVSVSANPTNGGSVTDGGSFTEGLSCTVSATANQGYTFVNWTENGEVVSANSTYTFTVNGNRTLVANFAIPSASPYVDLGLPSGTLWATWNVGAASPEGYGDYFAWGETEPKDTYNWSTYQYGDGNTFTKYNGSDGLTTLLPEDDAATANWGNGWRMPTKEEWQELYNNTTMTWTQQNGVNGRLFAATNGNSLFLPAAGYRYGSSLGNAGSYGNYWSGSLNTGSPYHAWRLYFYSDSYGVSGYNRGYGQSIRAVRSSGQN